MHLYAPIAFSDSDWGADTSHRRSVSGILIMVAGAAVVYKTNYQKAVALSSTEAEFVSASDAGKLALYVGPLLYQKVRFVYVIIFCLEF